MEEQQAHIQLTSADVTDDAIIVGDPARIDRITRQLDDFVELKYNREFRSVKGSYKGKTILILSTGVGAPSTAIAIEELHHIGVKRIIRVGSAGALQADIQLGAILIGEGAVRDDGLSKNYVPEQYPATPASDLLSKARRLAPDAVFGIIRSHDGFYMDGNEQTQAYWSKMGIIGEDMESGALMTVGRLRGMATLSILNNIVLYESDLQAGVNDLQAHAQVVEAGEKRTIRLALDLLSWEEK
ncbi:MULTISPECIES: nucleoside phosphorylase [unclassified Lactococcus]|uniref:nucleoside phosphorylase n=1 Tax=unclassified Lactococcus TaxID=2643510 RepID=UPI0011CB0ECC|nr:MULTISPECIES: nucleoside phosphorylase [unclassified Lactococcus]MQW23513.1 nucleoside phosphorylase [Lactococcus sp. dk101]TXK37843.1 nucleoside phosphorylase [Lactococcus sp. dk310]TXK49299.1 nucleoside phosphorylase [Lactococcus sp. dk322]